MNFNDAFIKFLLFINLISGILVDTLCIIDATKNGGLLINAKVFVLVNAIALIPTIPISQVIFNNTKKWLSFYGILYAIFAVLFIAAYEIRILLLQNKSYQLFVLKNDLNTVFLIIFALFMACIVFLIWRLYRTARKK